MNNKVMQDIRGNKSASRLVLVACLVIFIACVPIGVWWCPQDRVPYLQFVIEKAVVFGALAFGTGKVSEEFGSAVSSWIVKVRGLASTKEDPNG